MLDHIRCNVAVRRLYARREKREQEREDGGGGGGREDCGELGVENGGSGWGGGCAKTKEGEEEKI